MDPMPRPPPTHTSGPRAVIAFLVVVGLVGLTLGYHDGAFGTEDVAATDLVEGTYRFKGMITDADGGNGTFRLRDESGTREFLWNITRPEVGQVYVVDADVGVEGKWQALALTRILVVEGRWS